MEAKDKTLELINKFENLSQKKCDCLGYSCTCFKISRSSAKLFAIVALDFMIEQMNSYSDLESHLYKRGSGTTTIVAEIICLETIKKEIENLHM